MSSTTAGVNTEMDTVPSDLFTKLLLLKDVHDEHVRVLDWLRRARGRL
jgi:hypothetical protein